MANEQNLRARALTSEEAREMGRRGGIASGEARRQRRLLRETLGDLMTADYAADDVRAQLNALGIQVDAQSASMFAILRKAMAGDVEAARFIRDTLGEKPTETFNLGVLEKPVKSLDLSGMSDEELARLADRAEEEDARALPQAETVEA